MLLSVTFSFVHDFTSLIYWKEKNMLTCFWKPFSRQECINILCHQQIQPWQYITWKNLLYRILWRTTVGANTSTPYNENTQTLLFYMACNIQILFLSNCLIILKYFNQLKMFFKFLTVFLKLSELFLNALFPPLTACIL